MSYTANSKVGDSFFLSNMSKTAEANFGGRFVGPIYHRLLNLTLMMFLIIPICHKLTLAMFFGLYVTDC